VKPIFCVSIVNISQARRQLKSKFCFLRWSDIDFSRETAKVQRALVWSKGGGFKFAEPKTKKSCRSISLPKSMIAKLKIHRKKQLEYRFKLGQAYHNLDLVVASEVSNPLHYRNLTQRHYEKILENAGLREEGFVLYSLRHSCATLLLLSGVNPKIVAERLGHIQHQDDTRHLQPRFTRYAKGRLGQTR
jgi:integrase